MTYDPKHEARALDALAKDMGLHDHANVDAALGLPLVMTGPDSTRRLDAVVQLTKTPHDGTKPGPAPSRTDAASLSETQARRDACRAVERWAYRALLASGLTPFQLTLLKGYHDSVYHTRIADLNVAHAREDMKKGGAK